MYHLTKSDGRRNAVCVRLNVHRIVRAQSWSSNLRQYALKFMALHNGQLHVNREHEVLGNRVVDGPAYDVLEGAHTRLRRIGLGLIHRAIPCMSMTTPWVAVGTRCSLVPVAFLM